MGRRGNTPAPHPWRRRPGSSSGLWTRRRGRHRGLRTWFLTLVTGVVAHRGKCRAATPRYVRRTTSSSWQRTSARGIRSSTVIERGTYPVGSVPPLVSHGPRSAAVPRRDGAGDGRPRTVGPVRGQPAARTRSDGRCRGGAGPRNRSAGPRSRGLPGCLGPDRGLAVDAHRPPLRRCRLPGAARAAPAGLAPAPSSLPRSTPTPTSCTASAPAVSVGPARRAPRRRAGADRQRAGPYGCGPSSGPACWWICSTPRR